MMMDKIDQMIRNNRRHALLVASKFHGYNMLELDYLSDDELEQLISRYDQQERGRLLMNSIRPQKIEEQDWSQ